MPVTSFNVQHFQVTIRLNSLHTCHIVVTSEKLSRLFMEIMSVSP